MGHNLAGKSFGNYIVIKKFGQDTNDRSLWLCRCACGNEVSVKRHRLTSGKNSKCKRCRVVDSAVGNTFIRYKLQARQRNFEFLLTKEDIRALIFRECSYCGKSPSNTDVNTGINYNGIDRIDNSLGYSTSNCVSACKWCNRSKGTRSLSDFHRWIVDVYERSICDRA